MIGTAFFGVTQYLAVQSFAPGETPEAKTAYVAAGVAGSLFLANLILSCFLPEPKPEQE